MSSRAERRNIPRYTDENSGSPLMNNAKFPDYEADLIHGKSSDEHQRMNVARDFEESTIHDDKDNGLVRSGNGRNVEKSETEGPWRPNRMDSEALRYQMDGPSRHDYVFENQVRNIVSGFHDLDLENLRDDRAEAFRRLDELNDRLGRSGNLINKGKEKVPHEHYYRDPNFGRQRYQKHYAESFPRMNGPEMGGYGFYAPTYDYDPSRVQGFGDPLRSHMVRRRSHQDYNASQAYMSGLPYVDDVLPVPHYIDPMKPYPFYLSHHHPSCSCHQCLDSRHVPLPPTAYRDKYANIPSHSDKMSNYHENPSSFGPRDYVHWDPPHLMLNNRMSHTRWLSDVDSETDGTVYQRAPRDCLASSKLLVQHHRPVAGGAPFLTCYSCSVLLVLPKRVETRGYNKIRCGACSSMNSFVFLRENNSILLAKENESIPYVEAEVKNNMVSIRGGSGMNLDQERTVLSSDDSDYGMLSMNREVGEFSMGQGRVNEFAETKNLNQTSTTTFEVEDDTENSTFDKKGYKLAEDSRPPAGSPLQEHFEFSNKYNMMNHVGEGSRSERSKQDKVLLPNDKPTVRYKRAPEIDSSSNEYNTGTTFESDETSGEVDKLKHSGKSAESLLGGVLRRSVKDSNRTSETPKQEKVSVAVIVNEHRIPDGLVAMAEKLAGKIQPGNYWYDFHAGFWGVVGGPCLGIIPPFIEEFNYPMLEHCAGGNTLIFVNGRELNQKDLNLLASRGLPTESHRSYTIEISGRVLDDNTGEELESLGKLAPIVERMNRGFGMKVPKSAALHEPVVF